MAGRTATAAQREVLEASVAVVLHIIDGMRPGASCGELFERGSSWLTEHGFEAPGAEASEGVAMLGQSYPSFGHSLGLAWENPSIVEGEQAVLEPNMVIAVEAEVGRPGSGHRGVRAQRAGDRVGRRDPHHPRRERVVGITA